MLVLGAKIKMDATELSQAEGKLTGFADKFEHKFMTKLNKAMGIGAIAGFFAHITMKTAERAEAIANEAEKLGLTAEQYQIVEAAAKDAGQGVDQFIQSAEKQGKSLLQIIPTLEKFRNQIKMANDDVRNWANLKWGLEQVAEGAARPIVKAGTYGASMLGTAWTGLKALGAMGAGPFRKRLGIMEPEDIIAQYLLQASGINEGGDVLMGGRAGALEVPSNVRRSAQWKKINALKDAIREAENAKAGIGPEPHFAWDRPHLTSRQQVGAYGAGQGILVMEAVKTNQKLDEANAELRDMKNSLAELEKGLVQ